MSKAIVASSILASVLLFAVPAIDSGEAKTQDFGTDFKGEFRYKSGISGKLEWERVNEITWKLSGTFTNVPTSHGQWVIKRSR